MTTDKPTEPTMQAEARKTLERHLNRAINNDQKWAAVMDAVDTYAAAIEAEAAERVRDWPRAAAYEIIVQKIEAQRDTLAAENAALRGVLRDARLIIVTHETTQDPFGGEIVRDIDAILANPAAAQEPSND